MSDAAHLRGLAGRHQSHGHAWARAGATHEPVASHDQRMLAQISVTGSMYRLSEADRVPALRVTVPLEVFSVGVAVIVGPVLTDPRCSPLASTIQPPRYTLPSLSG